MTDDTVDLTRRKILAGLSAIGASGAAAGLGTSAFFSDTESFEDNAIAAGELDLAVDWEEHYSYPQGIEGPDTDEPAFDDPAAGLDHDVYRPSPAEWDSGADAPSGAHVGLPDPDEPVVWVHGDDLADYMANTAIEAFPDPDDDGSQELSGDDGDDSDTSDPCEDGARLPEHLDPDGRRSDNPDTNAEGGQAASLVDLADVKPGDFGELTLSFQLCGNPGYVWLRGAGSGTETELAESIRTVWWYDADGDNVLDQSAGPVDVMLAVDTSESLDRDDVDDLADHANDLARELDDTASARVGGLTFGGDEVSNFTGLADGPVDFSGLHPDGNTPLPAAMEIASAELDANARTDAKTVVVVFTDGGPNYRNHTYEAGGYSVGSDYERGDNFRRVTNGELTETADIADELRADHDLLTVGINGDRKPTGNWRPKVDHDWIDSLSDYLEAYVAGSAELAFHAEDIDSIGPLLDEIRTAIVSSEQVFHRGTLAEDLETLSSGYGLPLDGDLSSDFDEIDGDPATGDRECFQPNERTSIGFGWWLPVTTGNDIQGETISFDLGFYAEQCRNNDGSGAES